MFFNIVLELDEILAIISKPCVVDRIEDEYLADPEPEA